MPEFLPIPYARHGSGLLLVLCSALIAGCAQGGAGSMAGDSREQRSALSAAQRPEALVKAKRHTQSTCPTAYNFKATAMARYRKRPSSTSMVRSNGTTPTGGYQRHWHGL